MTVQIADVAHAAVDAAIHMLKQQGMEQQISQLPKYLLEAAEAQTGANTAILITPSGNAGSLAKAAAETLKQRYGRTIAIVEKADPSLIGGAILQFGDDRIDVSLKGALKAAQTTLASA